ncbi:MAG: cytochrome b/b6 domain-containing protein [Candidatus Methylomirabilales bacterium]
MSVEPSTLLRGQNEVVRFSATERAFHWAFALPFLGLLLSGLPLSFPILRSWITGYSLQIGVRLHLVCAVAWLLAPALVVMFGDRRVLARVVADLFVILRNEWRWLRQSLRWLAGLACDMRGVSRFNAGQKLNAWLVAVGSLIFVITGIILWIAWQWPGVVATTGVLTRESVEWSRRPHYLLTILMLAPLLGHIVLATIHPRTKGSLRGMLFGVVDAEWAREHHPVWFAQTHQARRAPGEGVAPERKSSRSYAGSVKR